MVEMKSKADADRKEVRKMLNQASQVKEEKWRVLLQRSVWHVSARL